MPLVRLSSGEQFVSDSRSSILDGAALSGITLPYSCRVGRCSACKCKVLAGDTRALTLENGLNEQEKAEGWILSCARAAETDVLLEGVPLDALAIPPAKTLPCRISDLRAVAPDVIQAKLRLPPTASFTYLPGQYIHVIGKNGLRRSYSLANAPDGRNALELHIRAVEGGAMSEYWFGEAKVDDLLRLHGPLGTFFMRDTADLDLVFLATGTGIAPIKAMMESLVSRAAEQRPRSITVVWGARARQDLYFDMLGMPTAHTFVPVLSRADDEWQGARGYVQHALLAIRPNLENAAVYACGSETMIHAARELLTRNGLPVSRFFSDAFVCSSNQ